MTQNQRPQPTAEDKKNVRIGCGVMLAALLVVGGCSALINDDDSASSSSSSSSTFDDKPNTVTVGDFVGMGLQAAQDAAQGDGIYNLDSTDATGQGRQQLWDRNWTVCAQTPAAGDMMSADDALTFDTVKSSEGETCDDPTGSASSDDSTISGTEDDYSDDSSSTVAGTGDDSSNEFSGSGSSSSTGGSDPSGDSSSSSSSSAGSQQAPGGATAQCNDGSYSYSAHRRGTCSHHGGVAVWLASVPS
ncbi:DUF3761 domain-containing protein [Streptomyces sirii]|uniref:DUF3761 domain-containing protein n=1 Tax=Streptomyces sirii TaxID=3127701 RepID=UPI003D36C0B3